MTQQHTILVVEDETSIASFVSAYLRNAGYEVRAASSAKAALVDLAGELPSLIVLDLNLPDGDGVELCRRIRKSSDVPILMLTARDEDVDKIIGLEVGAALAEAGGEVVDWNVGAACFWRRAVTVVRRARPGHDGDGR